MSRAQLLLVNRGSYNRLRFEETERTDRRENWNQVKQGVVRRYQALRI